MERKFSLNVFRYIFYIWLIGVIFFIFIAIMTRDFYIILAASLFALVYCLLFFILRKVVYAKVILNEEGINIGYRKKIIKTIKWSDMKMACIANRIMYFTSREVTRDTYRYKRSDIYVVLDIKNCLAIKEFKPYIKSVLMGLDTLHPALKEKFMT